MLHPNRTKQALSLLNGLIAPDGIYGASLILLLSEALSLKCKAKHFGAMILVSRYIFFRGYVGLTLYPFIILKARALKSDTVLLNHEKIHLRQQGEMLLLPFYLWYVTEWLVRYCLSLDAYAAYRNISFEREAYANESNPGYLEGRAILNFIKYL